MSCKYHKDICSLQCIPLVNKGGMKEGWREVREGERRREEGVRLIKVAVQPWVVRAHGYYVGSTL